MRWLADCCIHISRVAANQRCGLGVGAIMQSEIDPVPSEVRQVHHVRLCSCQVWQLCTARQRQCRGDCEVHHNASHLSRKKGLQIDRKSRIVRGVGPRWEWIAVLSGGEPLAECRTTVREEFSGHDKGLTVYHLGCRMGEILLRHCPTPKKHPRKLKFKLKQFI